MKLMIDIPENVVTAIRNGEDYRYDIHTAIAQGIPYEEKPQVTVFAENASKEEIEDFKNELKGVLERPQGEWIEQTKYPYAYNCTNCGFENTHKANFCEKCGADMKKGGAEE